MSLTFPRRSVLKGAVATLVAPSAFARPQPPTAAATFLSAPPYPAPLTSLGYTGWSCVFNPNLTLPLAQVIGINAVNTPLSWTSPPWGPGLTGIKYSTSSRGLTMTYLAGSNFTAYGGCSFSTMDYRFNGKAWGAPVYVEGQFTASLQPMDQNYNTCFWMTSEQAWNPAQGGNSNGGNGVGKTAYNRCEFDMIEICDESNLFDFPQPPYPIYASSTYHLDTGGSGPAGADNAVTNTYQQHTPATSYLGMPMNVSGLWLNGTGGFPHTCTTWWNGAQVLTGETWPEWSNPAPFGHPTMWVTGGTYPFSSVEDMTYTLSYIRVWTP